MEQLSRGAVGLLTRQSIRWRDVPLPSRRLADEVERIGFGQIVCVLDAKWQPVWSPPPLVRRRVGIGRPKPGPVRRRDLEAIPKT